jgi:hypothetical protein
MHLLLFFKEPYKLKTTDAIDSCIMPRSWNSAPAVQNYQEMYGLWSMQSHKS